MNVPPKQSPLIERRISQSEEVRNRQNQYTVWKGLTIYCATWNVANCNPPEDVLKEWLFTTDEAPDLYAVSLQEVIGETNHLMALHKRPHKGWNEAIFQGLNTAAEYEEVESARLFGISMTVFAKTEVIHSIRQRAKGDISRGVLNMIGNKGAVGISFRIYNVLVCFVNSHFAAHQNEFAKRNEDFFEIEQKLAFDGESLEKSRYVRDHDAVFWMGDLNYRVNDIFLYKKDIRYPDVMHYDQLHIARTEHKVFQGYDEGLIAFPPTYKYDIGTDNYDSSAKMRLPAWCDRILWRAPKELCHYKSYSSVMTIRQSDHKPVYATFSLRVLMKDPIKLQETVREVSLNDTYECDLLPEVTISRTSIDFRTVKINDHKRRTLTLTNTSVIPVSLKISTPVEYLKLSCLEAALLPEQELNLRIDLPVTTKVGNDFLRQLVEKGSRKMGELVINVRDGMTIIVPFYCDLRPSCFGMDFESLLRLRGPMATQTWETIDDSRRTPLRIPRELVLLVDFFMKNGGLVCEDLFVRGPKDCEGVNKVREVLDSWGDLSVCDPYEVAGGMLKLLQLAPSSVVSMTQYEVNCSNDRFDFAMRVLKSRVSNLHWRIFLYICLFLRELPLNINKTMDTIFANVLFHNKDCDPVNVEKRRKFLELFLKSPELDAVALEEFNM